METHGLVWRSNGCLRVSADALLVDGVVGVTQQDVGEAGLQQVHGQEGRLLHDLKHTETISRPVGRRRAAAPTLRSPCPAAGRRTLCYASSSCPSPGRSSADSTRPAVQGQERRYHRLSFISRRPTGRGEKLTARNSLSRSSMLPLWMVKRAAAIWLMALARQWMLLQWPVGGSKQPAREEQTAKRFRNQLKEDEKVSTPSAWVQDTPPAEPAVRNQTCTDKTSKFWSPDLDLI